jgi:chaperonin GroES|tara:strand:+ start:191 stop:466 length:276 start_codon:yes stop_codon:yes gene_type:complete
MNVKPILDKLYIKPAEAETKTAGGIFIPGTATESPTTGTVIAVGTGRITRDGSVVSLVVKEGDVVMYNKGAGIKVDDYLILAEDQVLAVIE